MFLTFFNVKILNSKFLLTFLLLFPLATFSQVKIKVNIENHNDSIFYLLKYKTDKSCIVIDSTDSNKNTFSNDTNYPEGIYVIADNNQKPLFEILLSKDQKFSINIQEPMDYKTYKVKGCKITSEYFDIYAQSVHYNLYIKALESEIKHNPSNKIKIDSLTKELRVYQESKLTKKDSFLNTYIKFIEKVVIPDELKDNDDSARQYVIEHYFDELPLCDTRILNSRLLKNRLDEYFDNIIAEESVDLTCKMIDNLLAKTNDCHDVRDYILWNLYSRYFNPKELRHEETFIYLVDKYFSELEIVNLTENIRNKIIHRAKVLKNITIGSVMPDLSFTDKNGNNVSIKDVKSKNTIVIFHKTDCNLCHKAIRILSLIEKRNKNLKIIDINITDEISNQDIISRYDITNVPTIYVLDKDKRIIAKNIKAEEVEFYLKRK